MGLDGSNVVPLTKDGPALQPLLSPDGSWVYYTSPVSGQPRPFKVPIDGGAPVSLGDIYFRATDVSADGRRLLGIAWEARERRRATWYSSRGKRRITNH
jgi:Tol biopolymer transport system component